MPTPRTTAPSFPHGLCGEPTPEFSTAPTVLWRNALQVAGNTVDPYAYFADSGLPSNHANMVVTPVPHGSRILVTHLWAAGASASTAYVKLFGWFAEESRNESQLTNAPTNGIDTTALALSDTYAFLKRPGMFLPLRTLDLLLIASPAEPPYEMDMILAGSEMEVTSSGPVVRRLSAGKRVDIEGASHIIAICTSAATGGTPTDAQIIGRFIR
jgi:hypothetical protein